MKAEFLDNIKKFGICDPITGYPPQDERALSGLLCLYSQQNKIIWNNIPLRDVADFSKQKGNAADFIDTAGVYLAEYKLLGDTEGTIWNDMSADIMYASADYKTVVIFENKIGPGIGYEPSPVSNQFARQLEYLIKLKRQHIIKAALFLISPEELLKKGRFCGDNELKGALTYGNRDQTVPGYLIAWEDIFKNIRL